MARTFDAVVVGSGVNGLAAAAELAKAGWSVALVERNDRLGGLIATEERTVPGCLHDTYSSWHSLFVSGGAYAAPGEDLHRHGLQYRNTEDARGAGKVAQEAARTGFSAPISATCDGSGSRAHPAATGISPLPSGIPPIASPSPGWSHG